MNYFFKESWVQYISSVSAIVALFNDGKLAKRGTVASLAEG